MENESPTNLALDLGSDPRVARVYLELACGYLPGQGAPTLTRDCRTYPDFEQEIERLKGECDALLADAKPALTGEAVQRSSSAPKAAAAAVDATKRLVPIPEDLCVADRMTRDVRSMRRNDKLSVARELMQVGGFRHVLVLDDSEDRLVGVISHRDIFYSALAWATGQGQHAHEQALDQLPAKEVMSPEPTTISPSTALGEAARLMIEHKIGCLPVLEGGSVVGILSEGDFLSLVAG